MYCHKCGKQITDGSAFCSYCGAQQNVAAPTQSSYGSSNPWQQTTQSSYGSSDPWRQTAQPTRGAAASQPQSQPQPQTQQKQKSKKGWLSFLVTLVVIVAFRQVGAYIGKNVVAPAMMSDDSPSASNSTRLTLPSSDERDDGEDQEENGGTDVREVNQDYKDVFVMEDGRRIFHVPQTFVVEGLRPLDRKSFAMKDENGTITCRDYAYRDDMVHVWVETWYYPGISADQTDYIELLNESAEGEVARFSDIACACVTYSYEEAGGYFKLEYMFTDLEQQENYQALEDMGLTTGSGAISMSLSEKADLELGYIPEYVE